MTSEPLGWGQLLRGEPGRGFELQLGWGPGGTPALPVSWTAVSLPAQPTQSPRLRLSWSASQGPGGCGGAYGVLRDPDPTPARGRDGPRGAHCARWLQSPHPGSSPSLAPCSCLAFLLVGATAGPERADWGATGGHSTERGLSFAVLGASPRNQGRCANGQFPSTPCGCKFRSHLHGSLDRVVR